MFNKRELSVFNVYMQALLQIFEPSSCSSRSQGQLGRKQVSELTSLFHIFSQPIVKWSNCKTITSQISIEGTSR